MFIPTDDRRGDLDNWVDSGPPITWRGIWWTLGSLALLGVLLLGNLMKG